MFFKSGLTQLAFNQLTESYQSQSFFQQSQNSISGPYVYVDELGVKFIADFVGDQDGNDGIFAVSVAEDGLVEMLSFSEGP